MALNKKNVWLKNLKKEILKSSEAVSYSCSNDPGTSLKISEKLWTASKSCKKAHRNGKYATKKFCNSFPGTKVTQKKLLEQFQKNHVLCATVGFVDVFQNIDWLDSNW